MRYIETISGVKKRMTLSGFKKIYFAGMATLLAVLLVFSFLTFYTSSASTSLNVDAIISSATELTQYERTSYDVGTGLEDASEELKAQLTSIVGEPGSMEKGSENTSSSLYTKMTDVGYTGTEDVKYVVQDFSDSNINYSIDYDTINDMSGDNTENTAVMLGMQPVNHIVIIPGTDSKAGKDSSAVLFMSHYDSMPDTEGATNAINVSSMVATIEYAMENDYQNDLVFVFNDGRYDSSVSAYAFKNQFIGFNNVYDRVEVAFNFDSLTTGGQLALVQSSDYDSSLVSAYASISGDTYTDGLLSSIYYDNLTSDFDIYYDEESDAWSSALNFMFINGEYDANSKYDNMEEIDAVSVANQAGSLMQGLAGKFGDLDLSTLVSGTESASTSFLGLNLVSNQIVIYIGAILLALLLAGVLLYVKKKGGINAMLNMLRGMGLAFVVALVSVGVFFVAYFGIGILLWCLGTVSMQMLLSLQYLSVAILIPGMLFAGAVSCGLYSLFKRAFKVKATDAVKGGALATIVTAVVLSLIFPIETLGLLILGYLLVATMGITACIKDGVKAKHGVDIERFMPYAWAMMLGLVFIIPSVLLVCNTVSLLFLPIYGGLFALAFTCITPYFNFLVAPMTKVYDKLPEHKIRVEKDITREVEDEAKKGKFHAVTTREIVETSVKWKYHNWFGVTVITTITAIVMIVCSLFSSYGNIVYGASVTQNNNYNTVAYESVYNNSLVYYASKLSSSATPTAYLLIKDESFFTKTRTADINGRNVLNDFAWDSDLSAYKYSVAYNEETHPLSMDQNLLTKNASLSSDEVLVVDVTPYTDESVQTITFQNVTTANSVTKMEVSNDDNTFNVDIDYSASDITVTLPYNFGDCTISIYSEGLTSCSTVATEYIFNEEKIQSDITMPYINAINDVYSEADYGMVIDYTTLVE